MQLSDLLDELRRNILNDRSDRTSGDDDYLWTDATLIRYIDEAQRRFARRSFIIRDNTTAECCNVTLKAGVAEYALSPAVLAVVSAKLASADYDLRRVGHSVIAELTGDRRETFDAAMLGSQPGLPLGYSTDETISGDDSGSQSVVTLRVFPVPRTEDAGKVIKLRVVRLPINRLTPQSLSAIPELPEDYHLPMLDWAAYLALRIVDQDAGNERAAASFAASFEEHVKEAKQLVLRKMRTPMPWGFGRGGWAWGS